MPPRSRQATAFAALWLLALGFAATRANAQEHVAKIGHLESPQQSRHVHPEQIITWVPGTSGLVPDVLSSPAGDS